MSYTDDFRHLEIPLQDIHAATNNFSDEPIGTGGFGYVYKGELLLPKGLRTVALKRLNRKFGQGDVEFWKEILMLTQLKHKNLASLLHFCREGDERILVYKYVSRGSLDHYLDKADLRWPDRLKILIGAAKGIAYLHDPKKTQQRVLHRDIKSSNILIDDKWTAKVSDFGLSKFGPANQSRSYIVSNIVGTPGYCDPAYFETGFLSKECDVYSFGVVMFEVLCGRLCCEFDKGKFICILVQTWKDHCDEDRLDEIIFPDLKEQINQESLLTFVAIAKRCLNRDHKERPNMIEVVKELEVALYQQLNPKINEGSVAKRPTSYAFMEEYHHLKIGLEDIRQATNNFSEDNLIGRRGYGWLYKGELSLLGGRNMVYLKRLDRRLGQGDAEFWNEIKMLTKYKHENIVSLLGFCSEGREMILVYNYASEVMTCGEHTRINRFNSKQQTQRITFEKQTLNCINELSVLNLKNLFSNVIKGGMYNGFTVNVTTQFLSPEVMYAVNLVFKHNGTGNGTRIPFKFELDEEKRYSNSCMAHVRDDGWLMIELYQFTSSKKEHDLEVHFAPLFDISSSSIVYFLEGIELFPVEYLS